MMSRTSLQHAQNPFQEPTFSNQVQRYLPSKLQATAIVLSLLSAKLAYDLFFGVKEQSPLQPQCIFGESDQEITTYFSKYKVGAENGIPLDQYCFAKMYQKGIGTLHSNNNALQWFEKAINGGVSFNRDDLCDPSLYCGIRVKLLPKEWFDKLQSGCCPISTPTICPWIDFRVQCLADDNTGEL